MASDLDLWKAFADQAGVAYSEATMNVLIATIPTQPGHIVTIESVRGHDRKNAGYAGMFTEAIFDAEGTLIEYGMWE